MTDIRTDVTDHRPTAGRAWLAGSGAWLVAAVILAGADDASTQFYLAESVWLVAQVLLLVGLIYLRAMRLDAGRQLGQVGFAVAILGRLVFVAAEILALVDGAESEAVLPVGALLSAIGMVLVGIAVLRARVWDGWRRYTPLAVGVYPFFFMFPLVALDAAPEVGVALWAVPTAALGVALLTTSTRSSRSAPTDLTR